MDDLEDLEFPPSFAMKILTYVAKALVADGTIDPTDKSADAILSAAQEYVLEHGDEIELDLVLDHTSDLLEQARSFSADGAHDFAVMFYATWVEHTLNGALSALVSRAGLTDSSRKSIIRMGLADKMGVGWEVVHGQEFPTRLRTEVLALAEARNAFVHYKWNPAPGDGPSARDEASRKTMARAQALVSDLTAFVDAEIYGGNGLEALPARDG